MIPPALAAPLSEKPNARELAERVAMLQGQMEAILQAMVMYKTRIESLEAEIKGLKVRQGLESVLPGWPRPL